ncbi:nitroreductase family protein [Guptibacillus hwajinpoensis]|uniref:nitroreductase family protein n=1 Tax=Guptibacillus hwajinpoensis TaxID=208199 RepID=UPI001CFE4A17|nr:nitroreductase [Pseudalkalibacillus hwajinpoensis]WLR61219.1 nitroreductase [Pseudalkalibacillus hwajinpoensis]
MYEMIQDTIVSRRTIRKFYPDDVPLHTIVEILEDAKWAPNHKFREPWEVVLYKGDGKGQLIDQVQESIVRNELDEEKSEKKKEKINQFINEIPIHLVVYMKSSESAKERHEDFAATCAFIQNFQLLSWSKGLGVVWKTNGFIFDPVFREGIGLEADDVIVGMLHIGKPAVIPNPKERKSIKNSLTICDTAPQSKKEHSSSM